MGPQPFPFLHISAFRGLKGLRLERCGRVNLLVGGNNSGKTSVLEALLLLAAPVDPRQWEGAVELRGAWPFTEVRFGRGGAGRLEALSWLFPHHGDEVGPIELAGGGPVGRITAMAEHIVGEPPDQPVSQPHEHIEASFRRRHARRGGLSADAEPGPVPGLVINVHLDWQSPQPQLVEGLDDLFRMVLWETGRSFSLRSKYRGPAVPVALATPISHRSDGYLAARVGRILRAKKKDQAIDLLRRLDAGVNDLVMVTPAEPEGSSAVPMGSRPAALHIDYEGTGLVPVHAMGDGMRRALHFATVVVDLSRGGVLLVDEIEVGMHTTVLEKVFSWLCEACAEAGVQLFATTHSLEAVDAMLEGAPDEDLVLYRVHGSTAKRFDGNLLRTARFQLGQEVR